MPISSSTDSTPMEEMRSAIGAGRTAGVVGGVGAAVLVVGAGTAVAIGGVDASLMVDVVAGSPVVAAVVGAGGSEVSAQPPTARISPNTTPTCRRDRIANDLSS